jgi:ABC-type molybdate transport system substrate-binding protein
MNGRSPTIQTVAALTGLMLSALVADAAELTVFTSVALTNALDELAPIFEQKTGHKADIAVGQIDLLCGSGQGRAERRGR